MSDTGLPPLATLPDDWTSGLAIAAHPDDFEYGMASAVAKWTDQGKTIWYVMVTRGEAGLAIPPAEAGPQREDEERRSAAVVGVDDVTFLDHRDGVVEYGLALRRDLAREVRRRRPDVVLTSNHRDSWGSSTLNMADHRHVGLATLDAARDAANPWIFPELLDEGFEPWAGVSQVFVNASPQSTHAVDVTGYLDRGIASLREHALYLEHVGTEPDAFLRGFAEATGARLGTEHAVSFEVINL
jgi:LmbE family N-acetylglucosaminyl deacetylase